MTFYYFLSLIKFDNLNPFITVSIIVVCLVSIPATRWPAPWWCRSRSWRRSYPYCSTGGSGCSPGKKQTRKAHLQVHLLCLILLFRIYNIKKACADQKSKPAFLSDKSLESSVKYIMRRFPNIDPKQLSNLQPLRNEILKSLSLYYYTFVDLLDYRDHVSELLTTLDACQISLDLTNNFDATRLYLNVVTIYVRLMILLSRVEDRKAVLGLFNTAHEMIHGQHDPSFPRLGQMIVEYDPPLKKLSEEFVPHAKTLTTALLSLAPIYPRRNLSAEQWRSAQMLSLVSNPGQLLNPAHTDTIPCEYLSLERMECWIVFGFAVCHAALVQIPQASELWTLALNCNWVMALFRDELLYVHSYMQGFFETIKGYGKKVRLTTVCVHCICFNYYFP